MEHGTLVGRYVAYLVAVDADLRHSNSHRTVVDHRSLVVELRLLLLLMDTVGCTRLGKEHVRAEEYIIVISLPNIVADVFGIALPQAVHLSTIDAHGDVTLVIGHEGETAGLLDGLVGVHAVVRFVIQYGGVVHRELVRIRHRTNLRQALLVGLCLVVEEALQRFGCRLAERLGIVAKELGEIIQAVGKLFSHLRAGMLPLVHNEVATLRHLIVVGCSAITVGVGQGVTERYAVRADILT